MNLLYKLLFILSIPFVALIVVLWVLPRMIIDRILYGNGENN